MQSIIRRGVVIVIAMLSLVVIAGQGYGEVIDYTYDENGNMTGRATGTDTTPPTGTIVINSGDAYANSQNVTLTLTCNDTSGCSQMQFSNDNTAYSSPETYAPTKAWTLSAGDATKTVYVRFKDAGGVWSTAYNDTILLDTILPTGTITINSGAEYTNNMNVTLTLTCTDTNGCSQMQFSNDNVTYSTPEAYATTKAWTLPVGNNPKTVYVKFQDTKSLWSIAYSDTITTPPKTTATPAGGVYTTAQTVTLACDDGTGPGCDEIYYTTNGDDPTTSSTVYSTPISITPTATLKYFAVDKAGNIEAIKTQIYTSHYVTKWGSYGTGDGQFNTPIRVALDASGNIYVADSGNYRIQKFSASGDFISKWGSQGTGNGQFQYPYGIGVDSTGNIYVVDMAGGCIKKFSSAGTFITSWLTKSTTVGTPPYQYTLNYPAGIAVDSSDKIYVVGTFSGTVQKYGSNGTFITKWGSAYAVGVAVDSAGNVYVADATNHKIKKYNSAGTLITQWGSSGTGNGQFNAPSDVAVDNAGNVYVVDNGNNRIQKFTSTGTFITKWGSAGSGDGQFNSPYGIAVDASGKIYVADTGNNRIQVFISPINP